MEGPSLVIACEEFNKYLGQPIAKAEGTAKLPFERIRKEKLRDVRSWGKHFILIFDSMAFRIHFLMFGSYRINNPRENRIPKLELQIAGDIIQFYSCAIKEIDPDIESLYDWSTDIMAKEWKPAKALASLKKKSKQVISDLLMDQDIFTGLGNIMKNEILFNLKQHPETKFESLDPNEQKALVKEARAYGKQFYISVRDASLKRKLNKFDRSPNDQDSLLAQLRFHLLFELSDFRAAFVLFVERSPNDNFVSHFVSSYFPHAFIFLPGVGKASEEVGPPLLEAGDDMRIKR